MKPLTEMSFDEMVSYCQGKIILAIPTGKFNEAVFAAMGMTLMWKKLQDEKKVETK